MRDSWVLGPKIVLCLWCMPLRGVGQSPTTFIRTLYALRAELHKQLGMPCMGIGLFLDYGKAAAFVELDA